MSSEHPGWSPGLFTIPGMGTGYVDNNGRISIDGRTVAYILPNGTIESFGGAYLGSIGPDGIVYGSGGTVEDVVNDGYSGSALGSGAIGGSVVSKLTGAGAGKTAYSGGGGLAVLLPVLGKLLPFFLLLLPIGGLLVGLYFLLPVMGSLGALPPLWLLVPGGAAVLLLLLALCLREIHPGLSQAAKWIGLPIMVLTALYASFFTLGLGAAWAIPLDFFSVQAERGRILAAIENCPGILRVFRGYMRAAEVPGGLILNRGMSGIFESITLLINHIQASWPFLLALVGSLAVIVLSFFGVVALIILLPVVGFLLPFLPVILLTVLVRRLFRRA